MTRRGGLWAFALCALLLPGCGRSVRYVGSQTTAGGTSGRDSGGASGGLNAAAGRGASGGIGQAGEGAGGAGGSDVNGGTSAGGAGGSDVSGGAGAGGVPMDADSCAEPEDRSRFDGSALYVDDDVDCAGYEPCFATIADAVARATSGDTVLVLPGTYAGADIHQTRELADLRISALDGPNVTTITGSCVRITGEEPADPGQIWVDRFTFRDCGPATSFSEEGWGVSVTSWSNVDVRIQDCVFLTGLGRGGVGLWSSTSGTRFVATVARNRFLDHHGEDAALDIDLPADSGEDYCIRVESNVIARSTDALGIQYPQFQEGGGRFEVANNTVVANERGVLLGGPAGPYVFVNNIVFGNERDFGLDAETLRALDVRTNLVGSGQFSGLNGNFAADPQFVDASRDDYRLLASSPAADQGDPDDAPPWDVTGERRADPPDIGAYERAEPAGESLEGLACGDGVVERGPVDVDTDVGELLGFETCDGEDDGHECSDRCQFAPSPPLGQLSHEGSHLCAIRADRSIQCFFASDDELVPTGPFEQVAASAYHGCGLRDDGTIACWRTDSPLESFTPAGVFTQIDGDHDQTCGVRDDGSIACWDDTEIVTELGSNFVRVDTNGRVCGLDAAGEARCYPEYVRFPSGPFVQMLPADGGAGCGLRETGELVCIQGSSTFIESSPRAAFVQVHADQGHACGLRPDGRVVSWRNDGVWHLFEDQPFIEVVARLDGCCGLTADRRVWCSDVGDLPAE